jgi:23S rRNA (guanosine2251-2'-O)-methyltransferase
MPRPDRSHPSRDRSQARGDRPAARRTGYRGLTQGLGGEQVEGRQAVRELLRAQRRLTHELLVAEGTVETEALSEILRLAAEARVPLRRVDRSRLDSIAVTDAPQGVVARADPVRESDLALLTAARPSGPAIGRSTVPFLVVLDGVTDPHNLGAAMRCALCAGVTGVVFARHRSARLTPAAVKSAAGAVEHLAIATVPGVPAAISELARSGVWTVAVDPEAAGSLWDLQVATEPIAMVLGAEGRGLSRLARQRCEVAVSIPLVGPLESLNVAAAAALACFEVARKREAATSP